MESKEFQILQEITGHTKFCPIIGHPTDHVVSPPSINAWFVEHQVDAIMTALNISSEALPEFWTLLRRSPTFLGCSVTYPHKRAAYEITDECTARVRRLGVLNTVRRNQDMTLSGEATDGLALCAAIRAVGFELSGKTAHVVGAGGGAGLAIVDALCEVGIHNIALSELNKQRLRQVQNLIQENWPQTDIVPPSESSADLIVNASNLGVKQDDPMPFSIEEIQVASCVCDIVGASDTPLLQTARHEIGEACVVDGKRVGQMQAEFQMTFVCKAA